MIRIDLGELVVECPSLEVARDLMILVSGAQRLVKVERGRVRRLSVEPATVKTLEDVAKRHAEPHVVLAPPAEPARLTPVQARAVEGKPPRKPSAPSPIMQHVRATVAPPEPSPAYLDGVAEQDSEEPIRRRPGRPRKDRSGGIMPKRAPVRGVDEEPRTERSPTERLHARIFAAFGEDETFPIPALAEALFGASVGSSVHKTKLLIEQLVRTGRLERRGIATYRVVAREDDAGDDQEDERDEDLDEDAGTYDPSEERPARFDGPIPSVDLG